MIAAHGTLLTCLLVAMFTATMGYAVYVLWLDWLESRDDDDQRGQIP